MYSRRGLGCVRRLRRPSPPLSPAPPPPRGARPPGPPASCGTGFAVGAEWGRGAGVWRGGTGVHHLLLHTLPWPPARARAPGPGDPRQEDHKSSLSHLAGRPHDSAGAPPCARDGPACCLTAQKGVAAVGMGPGSLVKSVAGARRRGGVPAARRARGSAAGGGVSRRRPGPRRPCATIPPAPRPPAAPPERIARGVCPRAAPRRQLAAWDGAAALGAGRLHPNLATATVASRAGRRRDSTGRNVGRFTGRATRCATAAEPPRGRGGRDGGARRRACG
jgi:hypothetical protein